MNDTADDGIAASQTPAPTRCGFVRADRRAQCRQVDADQCAGRSKVSIVSHKVQTHALAVRGIALEGPTQIILVEHARHLRAQAAAGKGDGPARPGAGRATPTPSCC